MKPPTLFVFATPLGNLGDISPRAVEALRSCSFLYVEDTRSARGLLTHLGIRAELESCHKFNEHAKRGGLAWRWERHNPMGLLAEAGTPGVSDPGRELVDEAWRLGGRVVPFPGPSAPITALSVSGFPADRFTFRGFLSPKQSERARCYEEMEDDPGSQVFFVSPRLARQVIAELAEEFPGRDLLVAREMTKLHEEYRRFHLPEIADLEELGEYTLVLSPPVREKSASRDTELLHLSTADHLRRILASGDLRRKDAVALVARQRGLPRKEVYRISLEAGSDE